MLGGMGRIIRAALLVALARWTVLFLAWPMRQDVIGASFLHTISIPFHEAGHVLFSPFGDLMTTLGGSLMQVLVPIACGIAFLTTSPDPFGAAVMGWWAGENLLDVALYINDARSLQLVLLGGYTGAEVEGHDWEHILQATGMLSHDHDFARLVQVIGVLAMLACFGWACVTLVRNRGVE